MEARGLAVKPFGMGFLHRCQLRSNPSGLDVDSDWLSGRVQRTGRSLAMLMRVAWWSDAQPVRFIRIVRRLPRLLFSRCLTQGEPTAAFRPGGLD
jgi:hypothetical protein